jgi:hypothetical protein
VQDKGKHTFDAAASAFVNGSIFLKRFLIRSSASAAFSPSAGGAFLFKLFAALIMLFAGVGTGSGTGRLSRGMVMAWKRRYFCSRFLWVVLRFASFRLSRHGRQVANPGPDTGAVWHALQFGSTTAVAGAVDEMDARSMMWWEGEEDIV